MISLRPIQPGKLIGNCQEWRSSQPVYLWDSYHRQDHKAISPRDGRGYLSEYSVLGLFNMHFTIQQSTHSICAHLINTLYVIEYVCPSGTKLIICQEKLKIQLHLFWPRTWLRIPESPCPPLGYPIFFTLLQMNFLTLTQNGF